MPRKKWTANSDTGDDIILFREKKKWQLALRRYVLDQQKCADYTRYFGVSSEFFREWIALQFTEGLNWDNYGTSWQFVHLVPVVYFDFNNEQDLLLCWNFSNIRVSNINQDSTVNSHNLLSAKAHFQRIYEQTGMLLAQQMVEKLELLQNEQPYKEISMLQFLKDNQTLITKMSLLAEDEFNELNSGVTIDDIILQRTILSKFG